MSSIRDIFYKKASIIGIIIFILVTNIAIWLDVPFLRQLLSLPLLIILPGLLIIFLMGLDKLGLAEKIVLTIGLSAAFLMFFGLSLNWLLPELQYDRPLTDTVLAPSLSGAIILLTIGSYLRNKQAFSAFPFSSNVSKDKIILLLLALVPLLSIIGTRTLITSGNNEILLFLVFLVTYIVILLTVTRRKISADIYPIALVAIGAGLLSISWLRSEHIIGYDVHEDYHLFHLTYLNARWSNLEYTPTSSCLSVTLLPAMFQSLLNLKAEELVFKSVAVALCTFTPLSIYVIAKNYLRESYAFLAAFFFISQSVFLFAVEDIRTNIAIFFFSLIIMVLFHDKLNGINRKGLFVVFTASVVVSHYSTTYIAFFMLLFVWTLGYVLRKKVTPRRITLVGVGLLANLIFLWYAQINEAPFEYGVTFVDQSITSLKDFFLAEGRDPVTVNTLTGQRGGDILDILNLGGLYLVFTLIAVGVIGTLVKRKQILVDTKYEKNYRRTLSFLSGRVTYEHFLIVLVSVSILAAMVILPYISKGYGTERAFLQMAVLLSGAFVIGGIIVSKFIRLNPTIVILFVLILFFMFSIGLPNTLAGNPVLALSSSAADADYELVHDEEIVSAHWFQEHRDKHNMIYAVDYYGARRLVSQGNIPEIEINYDSFFKRDLYLNGSYFYLDYHNTANSKLVDGWKEYDMDSYSDIFLNLNRIYVNSGSEIWGTID